jgi:hypothetical protein
MHHNHRGLPKRFGSSINLNLHYHLIVLEGIYLDRAAQGLKPKFVKLAPPSDADIAAVVTKIAAPARDRDASQTGRVSLGVGPLTQARVCPRPGALSALSSGTWRILTALTYRPVIRRIWCPLKLAADPPPLAPARLEQGRFTWTSI